MSGKYFIFGSKNELTKEQLILVKSSEESRLLSSYDTEDEKAKKKLAEDDNLFHTDGRVIVKVDMESKNYHVFENGLRIRRERQFNQFNLRIAKPVNCTIISGEGLPKNAEMLVDHNAFHESNRINDYKNRFENEESDRVRYFSVPRYECYAWREGRGDWKPIPPFEFALRVFKPYSGLMQGIPPEVMKDTLYVTSGELSGNVVKTIKATDYQIIFANDKGTESYLIVFRPFGDLKRNMEEEAIAVLHSETEMVNDGGLLVGYELSDAKKLNDAD